MEITIFFLSSVSFFCVVDSLCVYRIDLWVSMRQRWRGLCDNIPKAHAERKRNREWESEKALFVCAIFLQNILLTVVAMFFLLFFYFAVAVVVHYVPLNAFPLGFSVHIHTQTKTLYYMNSAIQTTQMLQVVRHTFIWLVVKQPLWAINEKQFCSSKDIYILRPPISNINQRGERHKR